MNRIAILLPVLLFAASVLAFGKEPSPVPSAPVTTGGTISGANLSGARVTVSNAWGATGTSARTMANMAADCTTPASYLARGQTESQLENDQIDVGPIINRMIGRNIKRICLPQGNYRLNTTINLGANTSITGTGAGTELEVRMANGDAILANSVGYGTLRDFTIKAQVARTNGAAIHLKNTFHQVIEHVYLQNANTGSHYDGIYLDGANDTHIVDTEMRGGTGDGIRISGTSQRSEDTYINETNINGGFRNDIEAQWSSGLYLSGLDLLGATHDGILLDPPSSHEVDGLRATLALADSNKGHGWEFAGRGPITETSLTNCWGATNGSGTEAADGLYVANAAVNNLVVMGSEFHHNTAYGIAIDAGQNIIVKGNTSFNNGKHARNTYSGIFVNTGAAYVQIDGNMSGQGGINAGETNVQKYGIDVLSTNHIVVTGNMTRQNMTGGTSVKAGHNVYSAGNSGN